MAKRPIEAVAVEILYSRDRLGFEKPPQYMATPITRRQINFNELKKRVLAWSRQMRYQSDPIMDQYFLGVVIQDPEFPAIKNTFRHPFIGQLRDKVELTYGKVKHQVFISCD